MIDRPDRKNFFLKKTRPNTALVFCEQEEAGLGVREGRYHFEEKKKSQREKKENKSVNWRGMCCDNRKIRERKPVKHSFTMD